MIGVALAGLVVVGFIGLNLIGGSAGGSGGASSPEGAVELLIRSIDSEDPLSALSALPPREVQTLNDGYSQVEGLLEESNLSAPAGLLSGIDVTISDVELTSSEITEDVARVEVTDAIISYTITPGDLAPSVDGLVPDWCTDGEAIETCSYWTEDEGWEPVETLTGELSLSDAFDCRRSDDESVPGWCYELDALGIRTLEFITVRDNGRWYVSPVYTVAEIATEAAGLSGGDFRRLSRDERGEAPEDVDDLFDQLADAVEAADPHAILSLMSVDTFGLERVYAGAIDDLLDLFRQEFGVGLDEIVDLRLDPPRYVGEEDGSRITVTLEELRGSGTITDPSYGDTASGSASYRDRCIETRDNFDSRSRGCLPDRFFELTGLSELFVVAVKEDGGVRLSPMATAAEYLSLIADNVDVSTMLRAADLIQLGEPTDELTLGEVADITLSEAGTWVGTFQTTDGQIICHGVGEWDADVEVFGPDGQRQEGSGPCVGPLEAGSHVVTARDRDQWESSDEVLALTEVTFEDLSFPATVTGNNDAVGAVSAYRFVPNGPFEDVSSDDEFYSYSFYDADLGYLDRGEISEGEEVLLLIYGSGDFEIDLAQRRPPLFATGSATTSGRLETGRENNYLFSVWSPGFVTIEVQSIPGVQIYVTGEFSAPEVYAIDDDSFEFYAEPGLYTLTVPGFGVDAAYTLTLVDG